MDAEKETEMSAVKREAEMAKADKKAHAEVKTQTPATAETPAVQAKAAPAKRNSRIKPIQDAIVPLLSTAAVIGFGGVVVRTEGFRAFPGHGKGADPI